MLVKIVLLEPFLFLNRLGLLLFLLLFDVGKETNGQVCAFLLQYQTLVHPLLEVLIMPSLVVGNAAGPQLKHLIVEQV